MVSSKRAIRNGLCLRKRVDEYVLVDDESGIALGSLRRGAVKGDDGDAWYAYSLVSGSARPLNPDGSSLERAALSLCVLEVHRPPIAARRVGDRIVEDERASRRSFAGAWRVYDKLPDVLARAEARGRERAAK